jgi:hypothetical protein
MFKNFLITFVPAVIGITVLLFVFHANNVNSTNNTIYVQETTTESGIQCIIATKGEQISLTCDFNNYE